MECASAVEEEGPRDKGTTHLFTEGCTLEEMLSRISREQDVSRPREPSLGATLGPAWVPMGRGSVSQDAEEGGKGEGSAGMPGGAVGDWSYAGGNLVLARQGGEMGEMGEAGAGRKMRGGEEKGPLRDREREREGEGPSAGLRTGNREARARAVSDGSDASVAGEGRGEGRAMVVKVAPMDVGWAKTSPQQIGGRAIGGKSVKWARGGVVQSAPGGSGMVSPMRGPSGEVRRGVGVGRGQADLVESEGSDGGRSAPPTQIPRRQSGAKLESISEHASFSTPPLPPPPAPTRVLESLPAALLRPKRSGALVVEPLRELGALREESRAPSIGVQGLTLAGMDSAPSRVRTAPGQSTPRRQRRAEET